MLRSSSSLILRMSRPSNRISPLSMRAGGVAMSLIISREVTLLPEPDSPTMPSVSPRLMSNDTPRITGVITPSYLKEICRFLT